MVPQRSLDSRRLFAHSRYRKRKHLFLHFTRSGVLLCSVPSSFGGQLPGRPIPKAMTSSLLSLLLIFFSISFIFLSFEVLQLPPVRASQTKILDTYPLSRYNGSIIYGTGWNENGELGLNDTVNRNTPTRVHAFEQLDSAVIVVSIGYAHTVVMTSKSNVYSIGVNDSGQLGIGTKDGSTIYSSPQNITLAGSLAGRTVTQVVSGYQHTLFLCSDDTIHATGYFAALGNGFQEKHEPFPMNLTNVEGERVVSMSSLSYHTLLVTESHRCFATGANQFGLLGTGVADTEPIPVEIDMSGALDGKSIVSASAGLDHSLFVTLDGHAFASGRNQYYELGDGTNSVRLSAVAVNIPSGKFILKAAASASNSMFLSSEGDVYVAGLNQYGELGVGHTNIVSTLQAVAFNGTLAEKKVVDLVYYFGASTILTEDKEIFFAGVNSYGAFGDSTLTSSTVHVPSPVSNVTGHNISIVFSGTSSRTFFAAGYCTGGSVDNGTQCVQCAPGEYSATGEACIACSAGTYSSQGAIACSNCSNITYSLAGASECTPYTCFGFESTNGSVCSGHGQCTGFDSCACDGEHYGRNCEIQYCFGIFSNETAWVCSGHGTCSSVDVCSCASSYAGNTCELPYCFGTLSNETASVCSGNGTCTSPNKCLCNAGFSGNQCERTGNSNRNGSTPSLSSAAKAVIGISSFFVVLCCIGVLIAGVVLFVFMYQNASSGGTKDGKSARKAGSSLFAQETPAPSVV